MLNFYNVFVNNKIIHVIATEENDIVEMYKKHGFDNIKNIQKTTAKELCSKNKDNLIVFADKNNASDNLETGCLFNNGNDVKGTIILYRVDEDGLMKQFSFKFDVEKLN